MEWIIGLVGVACIMLFLLHRGLKRAPLCTCNRNDCGGGCTPRPRANEGA